MILKANRTNWRAELQSNEEVQVNEATNIVMNGIMNTVTKQTISKLYILVA